MASETFPTKYFLTTVVQLLDTIKHKDTNYSHEERISNLRHAYYEASRHFSQPRIQTALNVKPRKLEAALRTISGMVVYCWVKATPEVMAALTIHYTYTLILDDSHDDPHPLMHTFFQDMMAGRQQRHPWLCLVNDHFPEVLKHYGPFCGLNIYRSTMDFFEGCWIEQYRFQGYRGCEDYPDFLRRLNGLGHAVGASIWPSNLFDERELFCEITTAICMMENWMVWTNDLISYYKEFNDARDQTSLVNNYSQVGGLSTEEALEKLTRNTIRVTEQILKVFADKDPRLVDTLTCFMHGYVTWHLCDDRYRMSEICEQSTNYEEGLSFRKYYTAACEVGRVDPAEWTMPTYTSMVASHEQPAAVNETAARIIGRTKYHSGVFRTCMETQSVAKN